MLNVTRNILRLSSSVFRFPFSSIPESNELEGKQLLRKSMMHHKNKTRYNGRVKKRKWEEKTEDDAKRECSDTFERIKRKKLAMLFGYSGVNYSGMQRNPNVKTIEEELLKVLLDCEYITRESFDQVQTMQFQRAARTDKGVSAAMQVISLKMKEEIEIPKINEKLPSDIKVFAVKRVTKGFNSKSQCDFRTYCYIIPTFAFENHQAVVEDVAKYRTTMETVDNLNRILKHFSGTKNYHNFTSKKHFDDPSSKRYMISFECGPPFIQNDVEFAVLKVKGQSFMLHQIRKMIGLTLAILRGHTDEATMERAFSHERLDLPMAPGLGLFLDQIHYDRYNTRYGGDGFHGTLTWEEVESEVKNFKENVIYPVILETEIKEKSMQSWLETLPLHSYDVRDEDRKAEEGNDNEESDDEAAVQNNENNVEKV